MKKDTTVSALIILLILGVGGFLFVHRRVIKAWIDGEPLPKAPHWHCWVKKEWRKSK